MRWCLRTVVGVGMVGVAVIVAAASAGGQVLDEETVKTTTNLKNLHKAYAFYEIQKCKPPEKVEDLPIENIPKLKMKYGFGEFGVSTVGTAKERLGQMVLAYEKEAIDKGGWAVFFDGAVRKVTAEALKKALGK